MANPLSIFSGPAQITTWDATNGYEYLGYNKEITVEGEPQNAELLDGNLHQLTTLYKLSAPLLQSNQTVIDAIKARRGVKQKLYIVGTESMLTIDNVLISLGMKRSFKAGGDAHTLELQAQTAVEDDVDFKVNLLGTSGKFETDSNSDGIADGWFSANLTASIVSSHLSNGGNAQKVVWDGSSDSYIRNNPWIKAPTNSQKVTFSYYVQNNDTIAPCEFKTALLFYDKDNTIVQSFTQDETLGAGNNDRKSLSVNVNTATQIIFIETRIWRKTGAVDLTIDNAQLEFGDLSTFRTD